MDIAEAKARDLERKEKKQEDVNSSKYRKQSNMKVGDLVYVQNYKKTSKFDPTYLPEPYEVTGVDKIAKRLTLKQHRHIQTEVERSKTMLSDLRNFWFQTANFWLF